MTATEMLDALDELGAELARSGDRVTVKIPPPGGLTPNLVEAIREHKPVALAYARACETTRKLEAGIVPAHYTGTTACRGCGPVPMWPGAPERVDGCPWCLVRARGLPIPRPQPMPNRPSPDALAGEAPGGSR